MIAKKEPKTLHQCESDFVHQCTLCKPFIHNELLFDTGPTCVEGQHRWWAQEGRPIQIHPHGVAKPRKVTTVVGHENLMPEKKNIVLKSPRQ